MKDMKQAELKEKVQEALQLPKGAASSSKRKKPAQAAVASSSKRPRRSQVPDDNDGSDDDADGDDDDYDEERRSSKASRVPLLMHASTATGDLMIRSDIVCVGKGAKTVL